MRHRGEMDADKEELLSLMPAALEMCLVFISIEMEG